MNQADPPSLVELVVMSRWPAHGRCKRRLAVGIGAAAAARVQTSLLRHTLTVARASQGRLPPGRLRLVLAADGLGPAAARRWGRELGMEQVRLQGAGSLGLRLRRQLLAAWRRRAGAVLVIGSDLPELEAADLLAAVAALAEAPLVLGPAADGGYWLIGLQRRAILQAGRALVAGGRQPIRWGSAAVLEQTLAAATAVGLQAHCLARRADLDRPADLARWR